MSIINHQISVSIDGRRLFAFKSFELKQSLNTHHSFELVIDIETGANRYVHDLKDSAAWLGKPLTVHVSPSGKPTFLGVITGVSLHRRNSDYGHILVKGRSATYRLETGLNCHSWNDRTIGEIVSELTASAGVRARVNPEYTKRLDYVCQYNESDFTFIRRLARQYNEWLYYDGTELIFGRPTLPDAVPLEFGTSLASLDIGVQALARPARVFSYRSLQDQSISEKTPDKPSGQDPLGHKAFLASMNLYKQPTRQYALSRIHYMSEMETYVRKKQEAETAESHYVRGTSENASLGVGSVVNLKSSFLERLGSVRPRVWQIPHHRDHTYRGGGQLLSQPFQGHSRCGAHSACPGCGTARCPDADGHGGEQCRPTGQGAGAGQDELADGGNAHGLDSGDDT